MKMRKRIFPRTLSDIGAFIFVLVIIPITYCFELFMIIPTMYEMWSVWYTLHFIVGTYIMTNVTSNFVATVAIDTSLRGYILPSVLAENWRFCSVCETVAPPRSWHCEICNTCILKRDHHCMFTGCCIGHFNYRFFYLFLLYTFCGTIYSTYFNSFYIWNNLDFNSAISLVRLIFPIATLVLGVDASEAQACLLVFVINLVAAIFTLVLLIYHTRLICRGMVTHESNKNIIRYDQGLMSNVLEVFGNKWFICWIFPFISSELPSDGINWKMEKSE